MLPPRRLSDSNFGLFLDTVSGYQQMFCRRCCFVMFFHSLPYVLIRNSAISSSDSRERHMFFRVLVHSGIKTLAAAPSGDGIFAWKGGCLVIYHWINGILLASSKFGQRQLEKLGDLINWLLMRTTYFNYIIWLLKETRNLWVNCWNMIFKQERMMVSYLKTISFPKPELSPDTTDGRPQ